MVVNRSVLKITGLNNAASDGKIRKTNPRGKQANIIYWLKNKVSTAVDLARISFSRIEERSDEILREYKTKLIAENLSVKIEHLKNNNIFLRIGIKNLDRMSV
jgi:hypothetical protein